MSNAKDKINSAIEKGAETTTYIKNYIDAQFLLKRSELSDGLGKGISNMLFGAVLAFFCIFILLFSLVALAFYWSNLMGSYASGFLSVAGLVLLIVLIITLFKKQLFYNPTAKKVRHGLLNGHEDVDEAELRNRVKHLEVLIEETSKDIPATVKELEVKDFLPDQLTSLTDNSVWKIGAKLATGLFKRKKD